MNKKERKVYLYDFNQKELDDHDKRSLALFLAERHVADLSLLDRSMSKLTRQALVRHWTTWYVFALGDFEKAERRSNVR